MGETTGEETLTKCVKRVGDRADRAEPLFEISTDKVDAEIPSPAAGTLTEIKHKEGETVEVNTVVAVLDGDSAKAAPVAPKEEAAPATETAAAKEQETPAPAEQQPTQAAPTPPAPQIERPKPT